MSRPIRTVLLVAVALFVAVASSVGARRITPPHFRTPIPCLVIEDVEAELHADVPLQDVHVDVQMIYTLAKVSLTQTYKSSLDKPIRVSYIFPMDDRATITSFLAEFPNGRKLLGVSKERSEASLEFENAVSSGHTAVLLDQQSSDVFRAEIGNLAAHEEVKITISYLTQVVSENSQTHRFTLPTVLAPRYKPSTSSPVISSTGVPYSLSFDMSIIMPVELLDVSSPTHEISAIFSGYGKATVTTQGDLDGDFVIVVKTNDEANTESTIIVEQDPSQPDHTALYVNLNPAQFLLPASSLDDGLIELYFVVDVSGSMLGDKMRDTIVAMKEAMRQLKDSKRTVFFNVLPFSSDFSSLFPSSQPLNDDSFKQSIDYIQHFEAIGGTELLLPLKHIFGSPTIAPLAQRRIIVLTDGLVGNTEEIFQLVTAHSSRTQVFTVGIGNGVSHALVNGLALHGSGVAEYVVLGEQVSEKMTRQLSRALSSTVVSIRSIRYLGPHGLDVDNVVQSPRQLPPLYSDSDVRFFALIPKTASRLEVTLSDGRKKSFRLEYGRQVSSDIIHKMAARSLVRDLELFLESDEANVARDPVKQEMRQRIIDIATKYNLMSSLTSYVAVDPDASSTTKPIPISVAGLSERGTNVQMRAAAMRMKTHAMPLRGSYGNNLVMDGSVMPMPLTTKEHEEHEMHDHVATSASNANTDLSQAKNDEQQKNGSTANDTATTEPKKDEDTPSQHNFLLALLEFIIELLGHLLG